MKRTFLLIHFFLKEKLIAISARSSRKEKSGGCNRVRMCVRTGHAGELTHSMPPYLTIYLPTHLPTPIGTNHPFSPLYAGLAQPLWHHFKSLSSFYRTAHHSLENWPQKANCKVVFFGFNQESTVPLQPPIPRDRVNNISPRFHFAF